MYRLMLAYFRDPMLRPLVAETDNVLNFNFWVCVGSKYSSFFFKYHNPNSHTWDKVWSFLSSYYSILGAVGIFLCREVILARFVDNIT